MEGFINNHMKKTLKFLSFIVFIILTCFLLPSCTNLRNSVDTNMVINSDGSGDRVINVEINKLSNSFKDLNYIDDLIASNCPKELEFHKVDDTYKIIYTFDLKFKSIDDYKDKIKALVDNSYVDFSLPNNVFNNGIELKENFSSKDILDWIYNDFKLSDLFKENIWKNQSTNVCFNDCNYKAKENIDITKINYIPIDRIDVISNLNKNNEIERTVSFYIPNESLTKLGDKTNEYLKSLEVENCKESINYTSSGEIFSISFSAKNCEELAEFMNKILAVNICNASMNTESKYLFETEDVLSEYLDFSSFASNDNGDIFIDYEIEPRDRDIVLAKQNKNNNWENLNSCIEKNKLVLKQDMKNLDINLNLGAKNEVEDVLVKTQINPNYKLQRQIILKFSNSSMLHKAKDYYENLKLENTNVYIQDDQCMIIITGTADQVNVAQRQILGKNNNISINLEDKMDINNVLKFSDSIDMNDFLKSINYKFKVNYSVASNLKLQTLQQKNSDSVQSISKNINSNNLSIVIPENAVSNIEISSNVLNQTFAINLIIIIFILFSVIMLLLYFFIRKYVLVKRSEDIFISEDGFYMSEYICPNCKMPIIIGMSYCNNCGVKLKKLK